MMKNSSTSNSHHPTESSPTPAPFVSKLAFCWLALLTGVVGGHWFIAGRSKRAILYILFIPLSAFAGWAECMRYGLMPDDQFNQRLNPDYPAETPQTTGLVVTAIGLSLAAFVTALMSLLAVIFQMILAGYVA